MEAKQVINAMGGVKAVQQITGLTKQRVYQFIWEDHIPRHWLLLFHASKPKLIPFPEKKTNASSAPSKDS